MDESLGPATAESRELVTHSIDHFEETAKCHLHIDDPDAMWVTRMGPRTEFRVRTLHMRFRHITKYQGPPPGESGWQLYLIIATGEGCDREWGPSGPPLPEWMTDLISAYRRVLESEGGPSVWPDGYEKT